MATPTTITIQRSVISGLVFAESTNVSRTFARNDVASEFEDIVVDEQADTSLDGAWLEACAKLAERTHVFTDGVTISTTSVQVAFKTTVPAGAEQNMKMYIVDFMVADWLGSVRPEYRQRYVDRSNFELDDLLRKLYKKEPPV